MASSTHFPTRATRWQRNSSYPSEDREAIAYVASIGPKVILIDGRRLAELMIDFELGANTAATYTVMRVDSDYFDEAGTL